MADFCLIATIFSSDMINNLLLNNWGCECVDGSNFITKYIIDGL